MYAKCYCRENIVGVPAGQGLRCVCLQVLKRVSSRASILGYTVYIIQFIECSVVNRTR